MPYSTLILEIKDQIATITLNRPEEANALNLQMAEEFKEAAIACASSDTVRAVVITGKGKMFCAGGDLREIDQQGEARAAHLIRMASALHSGLSTLANIDAPIIVAINGVAAGGGFSMTLAGDIILASDKAKLIAAYTASGLTPDGSSTYHLAKHVGLLRAKELLFTNRMLSATEACEWGLVTRVVPADDLMAEAYKLAQGFAAGPTKAFGGLKQLMLSAYSEGYETQMERETRGISGMMRTYDGPHGVNAFLNKKKPEFKGR